MIDHHAHPFDLDPAPLGLHRVAIDVDEIEGRGVEPRTVPALWRALLAARLAAYLRVDASEVLLAREEAASDYRSYVRGLFADAGITGVLLDPSWPAGSAGLIDRFADLSGAAMFPLVRVEPVVDAALEEGVGFDELVARFDHALERAATSAVCGLKSIAAYRTGLGIQAASENEARRSMVDDGPVPRRAKPLRDWLFRRMLAFAGDQRLPVQVHTGFGDADVRLAEANPLLLDEVLRTPEGRRAHVVLLHAGFPFVEEAAFLAASRPTVHVDLSLVNVFAPAAVADVVVRLVGLAPPERVLVGTDGYALPESFWFAAHVLRDGWREAAGRFRHMGLSQGWVDGAERAMFETNARELYRLS